MPRAGDAARVEFDAGGAICCAKRNAICARSAHTRYALRRRRRARYVAGDPPTPCSRRERDRKNCRGILRARRGSERKIVLWTVFREVVLPKAGNEKCAARRVFFATMRRQVGMGSPRGISRGGASDTAAYRAVYHRYAAYRERLMRIASGAHIARNEDFVPHYYFASIFRNDRGEFPSVSRKMR